MSEMQVCQASPRRFDQGGNAWVETCARFARRWKVSKGGHTVYVLRCDEHAAELRRRGYEVKLVQEAPKAEPAKRKWDMTSTHSLEAGAEYLRKNSGALIVLVIRSGDAAIALDKGIADHDVLQLMRAGLPDALGRLESRG